MIRSSKVLAIFFILVLAGSVWGQSEKKATATKSYQDKVAVLERILVPENAKNENYLKKAADIYAKNFSEDDLAALITFYQSPTGKKYISSNINSELAAAAFASPTSAKAPSPQKPTDYDKKLCEADLKYLTDDIEKGLSRYKRICGTEKFPEALDWAQDGKADFDNLFFSRVTTYTRKSDKWSKKGNSYSYTCGGTTRTFVYSPSSGTFK
jgi:hypothetical protein